MKSFEIVHLEFTIELINEFIKEKGLSEELMDYLNDCLAAMEE